MDPDVPACCCPICYTVASTQAVPLPTSLVVKNGSKICENVAG